jgi:hypothetical protein
MLFQTEAVTAVQFRHGQNLKVTGDATCRSEYIIRSAHGTQILAAVDERTTCGFRFWDKLRPETKALNGSWALKAVLHWFEYDRRVHHLQRMIQGKIHFTRCASNVWVYASFDAKRVAGVRRLRPANAEGS